MSGGRKKRESPRGAILSAAIILLLLVWMIGLYLWCMEEDPMPTWLFVILEAIPVASIVALLAALVQRLREIRKGELDEADQY
ncbi:MAG: hypothetical protein ACI3VN_02035 [Candidatus Onthomonas sp.]